MDQQRLDAIRARCEAATPGPGMVEKLGRYEDHDEVYINLADDELEIESRRVSGTSYENAEFIAASRTDIPDMLAEIDHLTAEMAVMTAELDQFRDTTKTIEAERDAWRKRVEAVIESIRNDCDHCKYDDLTINDEPCWSCTQSTPKWEWRGPAEGGEDKP